MDWASAPKAGTWGFDVAMGTGDTLDMLCTKASGKKNADIGNATNGSRNVLQTQLYPA